MTVVFAKMVVIVNNYVSTKLHANLIVLRFGGTVAVKRNALNMVYRPLNQHGVCLYFRRRQHTRVEECSKRAKTSNPLIHKRTVVVSALKTKFL